MCASHVHIQSLINNSSNCLSCHTQETNVWMCGWTCLLMVYLYLHFRTLWSEHPRWWWCVLEEISATNKVLSSKCFKYGKFYKSLTSKSQRFIFFQILGWYKFKANKKFVTDDMSTNRIRVALEEKIVQLLPKRDQLGRRIIFVEMGCKCGKNF